ncbi:MAG: hypothetical protein LBR74_07460 [Eubacterium sp.]|nr:hypothetical protein [Eubacterium sp.]
MNNVFLNFLSSIKKNIKSIILAFGISAILWLAISFQLFPDVTNSFDNLPIIIKPTVFMEANSLSLAKGSEFSVTARAEGKRYDIAKLTPEDISVSLDLSSVTGTGNYDVPVKIDIIKDIDFDCNISPDVATVNVDVVKILSKTLRVEPLPIGLSIIDGFQIDSDRLKTAPETITITGESDEVDAVTRVAARVMTNVELAETTEMRGELIFYNNGVMLQNPDVSLDNDDFNVTVAIHKVKTLPIYFSIVGYQPNFDIEGLASRMEVYPTEITISSPDNSIDSLERLELAQIHINELDYFNLRTIRRETISPILPEGYGNISRNASASLSFNDVDGYNDWVFNIGSENFQLINQPQDYNAQILTRELSLTVVGPASFVRDLNPEDITVTVNFMGVEPENGMTKRINVSCRISGEKVPAWVSGNPQVDVMFDAR